MKIVINSHKKGIIALDHLLSSMRRREEYLNYDILIVVGGYFENTDIEIEKCGNITYIYCNHDSIDFTGLITLAELYADNIDEYYFYLHDTCKIGDDFYKKLSAIDLTNVSSIKINKDFSMNIGVYSQNIINEFKDFLLSKKNKDEDKCMEFKSMNFKAEDHIFENDNNNFVLENYNSWEHSEPTDYYNTGTLRIVEYYPNIDLYKMKANWGQGNLTLNN